MTVYYYLEQPTGRNPKGRIVVPSISGIKARIDHLSKLSQTPITNGMSYSLELSRLKMILAAYEKQEADRVTISKERAEEILSLTTFMGSIKMAFVGRRGAQSKGSDMFDPRGVTEREDALIEALGDLLPDSMSYSDLVRYIAKNGYDLSKVDV